jgi:hypothetical protein
MNIEYVGFLGLGFQGKNLYVMFVFSIVSFLFFYLKFVCSKYCTRLKSTHITQCLDHNKLNARAWKNVALQTKDAVHPPQRHP